jgi:hypothetical protein
VEALSGYGSGDIAEARALSEISGALGASEAARALAFRRALRAKGMLEEALARPPLPPPVSESGWGKARGFLTGRLMIPSATVDLLHAEGLALSDRWGSAVFPCADMRGAFRMNFPGAKGLRDVSHPRAPASPFLIKGDRARTVVTDCPARALLIRSQDPSCSVLVPSRLSDPKTLLPYLEGELSLQPGDADGRGLSKTAACLRYHRIPYSLLRNP